MFPNISSTLIPAGGILQYDHLKEDIHTLCEFKHNDYKKKNVISRSREATSSPLRARVLLRITSVFLKITPLDNAIVFNIRHVL